MTAVDIDAQDALGRLAELRDQRQRVAPEARTDSEAAAELALIESQIADCEREIDRAGLADAELERRDQEAAAAKAAARRAGHLKRARELGKARAKHAATVDRALAEFAEALVRWNSCALEQRAALAAAGEKFSLVEPGALQAARPRFSLVESALARAAIDADLPGDFRISPNRNRKSRPLAVADQVSVPEA